MAGEQRLSEAEVAEYAAPGWPREMISLAREVQALRSRAQAADALLRRCRDLLRAQPNGAATELVAALYGDLRAFLGEG